MKLTEYVLNELGAGVDPNDTQCMTGVEMWKSNMVSGETLTESLSRLKSLIADGAVDKDIGTFAYAWGLSLKTYPLAIMIGGDGYVSTSSYKVSNDPEDHIFQSEEDALAYIEGLVAAYVDKELPQLNYVTRKDLMQMQKCDMSLVSEGDEVALFDAFTGRWVFFQYSVSSHEEALAPIQNKLIDQAGFTYHIMVKLVDDVDVLSAWVSQSEVPSPNQVVWPVKPE